VVGGSWLVLVSPDEEADEDVEVMEEEELDL